MVDDDLKIIRKVENLDIETLAKIFKKGNAIAIGFRKEFVAIINNIDLICPDGGYTLLNGFKEGTMFKYMNKDVRNTIGKHRVHYNEGYFVCPAGSIVRLSGAWIDEDACEVVVSVPVIEYDSEAFGIEIGLFNTNFLDRNDIYEVEI